MQDVQTKACTTLSEQEKMTDLLSGQKYPTSIYTGYCCEAATPSVKGCLSSILQDEHRIQEEIFTAMNTRGWYPTEKAEETKLNAAKMQFSGDVTK